MNDKNAESSNLSFFLSIIVSRIACNCFFVLGRPIRHDSNLQKLLERLRCVDDRRVYDSSQLSREKSWGLDMFSSVFRSIKK